MTLCICHGGEPKQLTTLLRIPWNGRMLLENAEQEVDSRYDIDVAR